MFFLIVPDLDYPDVNYRRNSMNNYNYRPGGYEPTYRNTSRYSGNRNSGYGRGRRRLDLEELRKGRGFAVASLVCGFLGLATCYYFGIGAIFGIFGVIFSIISSAQGSRSKMRIGGLVLSIISIVLGAIFGAVWLYMYNTGSIASYY